LESGKDAIATPSGLRAWLIEQRLLSESARVSGGDVRRAAALREGLRAALREHDDVELEGLNRELRSMPLHVQFNTSGEPTVAPVNEKGVEGAFAQLLSGIATAAAAGTWTRLQVCASDTCQWAFDDHSRNRSGRWCSM